jgi:hypothetical protein
METASRGIPLVEASQFAVDAVALEALFTKICTIFMRAGAEFSGTAKALAALFKDGTISVNALREAATKKTARLWTSWRTSPG